MNEILKKVVNIVARIKYRKTCKIEKDTIVYGNCQFEGKNKISPEAHIVSVKMGFASYIGKASIFSNTQIGRFCSIGESVKLVSAKHPIGGFASTHPAFYSTVTFASLVNKNKYEEYEQNQDGLSLVIGNDVWVGCNVLIKAGITIGDGAVIAMGSVVTQDVPDFAIVGGVPAHVIKYRFSEEQRVALTQRKWWNQDIKWIEKNAHLFENIDDLLVELAKKEG